MYIYLQNKLKKPVYQEHTWQNSFKKIKICLSRIKSFLEEEDDEEEDEEDEEVSNECEVIPFKSKEDSDEK